MILVDRLKISIFKNTRSRNEVIANAVNVLYNRAVVGFDFRTHF